MGVQFLFTLGTVLLGLSLLWYSKILKDLLEIMHKPPVWILPIIGAVLIVISGIVEFYLHYIVIPKWPVESYVELYSWIIKAPSEFIYPFMREIFGWRTVKFIFLFAGSLLSTISGTLYYMWVKR